MGKKNRDFFIDLSASRPDFPDSKAKVAAYIDEGGAVRIKGTFQSPTLKALPFPLPFDASADLKFALKGKESLFGHLSGTISPQSISVEQLRPWVEKNWKVDARVSLKKEGWEVSRFAAVADDLKVRGSAKFNTQGLFQTANLAVRASDSKMNAQFEIASGEKGAIAIKGKGQLAELKLDALQIEKVQAQADLIWQENALRGHGNASGSIEGKPWQGKSDLSWRPRESFFLSDASLEGPSIHASGNLEIRPGKILIGQTDLTIENLNELPYGLYGKFQGKTDWLVSNGKQVLTVDGTATGIYWKELFAEKISLDASIIDPFGTPQGRAVLGGELIKWRQMFLQTCRFETLIGANHWPFEISAVGQWKHPLELNLSGLWHYKNSDLTCSLQNASGAFYNHPIVLAKPVEFEYFPGLFRLSGLDVRLSDARFFLAVEKIKNDLTASLLLQRFPLDILSLNPLDIPIAGQTDCAISLREINGKVNGTLQASIDQLAVEVPGETPLVGAFGKFEGKFDNDRLDLKGGLTIRDTPLLTLSASLPIHIEMVPPQASLVYDQKASGHLALKGRIEEILDFFDLGTHRIEGDIACDFTLANTLSEPEVTGTLHFDKGYYENYLTGTRLINIQADGKANRDKFILDSLTASDGKGALSATGEIALRPSDFFPYLFNVAFTRFQIAQIDLVSAEAEGTIQITGDLNTGTAKGSLEVIQGDLHVPDRIPRAVPNLVVVYKNAVKPIEHPQLPPATPYPLNLDLEIKAPDGIFIDGRGVESEWKGDFHIGGTYTSIAAVGKLELIKGEFSFAGRRFKLLDGSLSFTGKEHEMPYLNLAAQMQVKEVTITARMKGPLNNPQLTLQSIPPLPMSTILSYLLFGQELAEINSFQALQLANSLASIAGQGPDVLESTRKALGVDQLNIVSVPSGDVEIEDSIAVQVGKYVSEGVLVSLTQGAEDASTNINIEIEVKGGWVIQLESDQRQEQGKFTIKWNHNY